MLVVYELFVKKKHLHVICLALFCTFDIFFFDQIHLNLLYEMCVLRVTFYLPDKFETICKVYIILCVFLQV